MSNVGSKLNVLNKQLNVIITNGTEQQLHNYEESKTSINAKNALIISIPTDAEGDISGAASLWITDSEGYILQLTKPIVNQNGNS